MTEFLRPRDIPHLTLAELASRVLPRPSIDPHLLRALASDPRRGAQVLGARLRARQLRASREAARLNELWALEREQRGHGFDFIAGVDEAGVAPLAGPVVAAAVILPPAPRLAQLDDSKRLTAPQRAALYEQIMRVAVGVHAGMASVEEIDRVNILQATRLAHQRAILGLPMRPQLVLIDGRYPAPAPVPQLVIVDGDATCASIAAASIVAKVTRDHLMEDLATRYPHFGFDRHKGYGTKAHLEAIRQYGITPAHRRSFFPVRGRQEMLSIG